MTKSLNNFQKKKAVLLNGTKKRNAGTRESYAQILIVCEGEVTEPNYFQDLSSRLGIRNAQIKLVGKECGSAPISVFNYGKKFYETKKTFDHIFFVFDRDSHPTYDKAIDKAYAFIKSHKLVPPQQYECKKDRVGGVITSFPCFEFWYYLHFNQSTKPYGCTASNPSTADLMISDLRNQTPLTEYTKTSREHFHTLYPNIKDSISRSGQLLQSREVNEVPWGITGHRLDPHTYVHMLVSFLIKFKAIEG